MEALLTLAIVGLVFTVLRLIGDRKRVAGRSVEGALRALADETGLRYAEDAARGPHLRGARRGVDATVFRTQLRVGEWFHCATAVSARALPAMVAHHRAFPHPSSAARTLARRDNGDAVFDRRFVVHAAAAQPLPVDVRAALLSLRCPELTVLRDRVTVVWSIDEAPSAADVESARVILEALAGEPSREAYR